MANLLRFERINISYRIHFDNESTKLFQQHGKILSTFLSLLQKLWQKKIINLIYYNFYENNDLNHLRLTQLFLKNSARIRIEDPYLAIFTINKADSVNLYEIVLNNKYSAYDFVKKLINVGNFC